MLAVAVVGNLGFTAALCMNNLVIKVRRQGCAASTRTSLILGTAAGGSCEASAPSRWRRFDERCQQYVPTITRAQVFLGSLREIELERVKEKLSSAIMETCLALTIFRCGALFMQGLTPVCSSC